MMRIKVISAGRDSAFSVYIVIREIFSKYSNYCFSDTVQCYFDKSRYQFCYLDEIKKLGYRADTQEKLIEKLAENNIIPSFTPDLYEFDKSFVESFKNKKLSEYFAQFDGDEEKYDSIFRVYIEQNNIGLYSDFFDLEDEFYIKEAEKWCKENKIAYRLD